MKHAPLFVALAIACASAAAQAPGEYELELWRSAARLDTPAAYDAYLRAFPQGAFAAMARAALARAGASTAAPGPTGAASAARSAPAPVPSTLPPLAGEVTSGSTELAVGTRLVGPGIVTVGSLGAKRQLPLPAGEWLLLAAVDHGTRSTVSVSMATLAFGQFSGAQLRTLLVATFNRRAVTVPSGSTSNYLAAGSLPRWTSAEACDAALDAELMRGIAAPRGLRRCAALRRAGDWREAFPDAPTLLGPLDRSLATLGAQVPAFAWRSDVHLQDLRYGYLVYTRLDVDGPEAARREWLRRFVPIAQSAYNREIDAYDLEPGRAPASPVFDLPS